MPRTRLYIDGEYSAGSKLEIDADKTRYLVRVLRLQRGDTLLVFDGAGVKQRRAILFPGTVENKKRVAAL